MRSLDARRRRAPITLEGCIAGERRQIPPESGLDKTPNQVVDRHLCTCRSVGANAFVNAADSLGITSQRVEDKGKSAVAAADDCVRVPGRPRNVPHVKPLTHTLIHTANPRDAQPRKMNDLQADAERCGEKHERYKFVARPHRRRRAHIVTR